MCFVLGDLLCMNGGGVLRRSVHFEADDCGPIFPFRGECLWLNQNF